MTSGASEIALQPGGHQPEGQLGAQRAPGAGSGNAPHRRPDPAPAGRCCRRRRSWARSGGAGRRCRGGGCRRWRPWRWRRSRAPAGRTAGPAAGRACGGGAKWRSSSASGRLARIARHRPVDQDHEPRPRQQADQPAAQPVEHHVVEAGVDREVDQRVEDAAVGEDEPAVEGQAVAEPGCRGPGRPPAGQEEQRQRPARRSRGSRCERRPAPPCDCGR